MGTISDKLMRIINTKEDIRQALISKGYDVPTSIPFKEYAKMISDLPCRVDSFPDIEGIVARYSALGLTNEQMAENPVWKDLTDNGHDLQMKNLAWKGMSGVGGYVGDFSKWVNNRDTTEIGITKSNSKVIIDVKVSQGSGKNIVFISKSNLGISNNVTIKITSTYPEGVMKFANSASNKYLKLPSNGIITLQDNPEYTSNEMHLHLASADLGQITIEQLPLYPGALVFDGVDDYGTCDNFPILTKEKGYTVVALRQWISTPTRYTALVSKLNIDTNGSFVFEEYNNGWLCGSFGKYTEAITVNNNNPISWQTSKSYNGESINVGTSNDTDVLSLGKLYHSNNQGGFANIALYSLVILDHDATEEELTKIKDYFVKTYPWLFPDQAWTVVGKTNEDEDRATITNITGNGNNLVLSNFGFAEGSGYGLYKLNFNNWFANTDSGNVNIVNVVNPHKIVLEQSQEAVGAFFLGKKVSYSGELKISVSNKPSDIELSFGSSALGKVILNEGINIVKINPVNTSIGFFTNKAFEAQNIIIEQIPEYEGYLVTDGVDDKVESSSFTLNKDWTIVGNWTMLSNIPSNCGIIKVSSVFLYNSLDGVTIYFAGGLIKIQSKSINAFCSDGRIYLNDWTEILKPDVQIASGGSKSSLNIASYSANFTKMAFKNLAIYDGKNLSKDDCIKAYNYLQTLKSK